LVLRRPIEPAAVTGQAPIKGSTWKQANYCRLADIPLGTRTKWLLDERIVLYRIATSKAIAPPLPNPKTWT